MTQKSTCCEKCEKKHKQIPVAFAFCPCHKNDQEIAQKPWEDKFRKLVVEEIGLYSSVGLFIPQFKAFITQLLAEQSKQMADAIEMARQEGYKKGKTASFYHLKTYVAGLAQDLIPIASVQNYIKKDKVKAHNDAVLKLSNIKNAN